MRTKGTLAFQGGSQRPQPNKTVERRRDYGPLGSLGRQILLYRIFP